MHVIIIIPLNKLEELCFYNHYLILHLTDGMQIELLVIIVVKELYMYEAIGIEGGKTNHSLRATAAIRLFKEGIDEQLIMK